VKITSPTFAGVAVKMQKAVLEKQKQKQGPVL